MNYHNISDAVAYYVSRGYFYRQDAPWLVSKAAYHATKPPGAEDIIVEWGDQPHSFAVASGEQSFLQMLIDGVALKRAVCVTPCYRVEKYNDWNKPYFMKAELINAHDVDHGHLLDLISDARSFFQDYVETRIVVTGDMTYDIVTKDGRIELGSYGIRSVEIAGKDYEWIYGTGCAEPRLSKAIAKLQVEG
jgi:hypothetical protein